MAATVTPLLTTISEANDATGWLNGVQNTTNQIQGTGCLEYSQAKSTLAIEYYDWGAATLDITNTHVYGWMNASFAGALNSTATGGLAIHVGDGTNYGQWYVGGNDNYSGGWKCFVVDTNRPFDNTGGTPPSDLSIVQYIGFSWIDNTNLKAGLINFYTDAIRIGSGLRVTAGTVGTPGTFDDIIAEDEGANNAYGIIRRNPETAVVELQGELVFGTSSAEDTYFQDKSETVIFMDKPVSGSLYKMSVEGGSSATSSFILGSKVGTAGVTGVTMKSATGSLPFDLVLNGANSNFVQLYGSSFQFAGETFMPTSADDTHFEINSCNFEESGEVQPSTCTVVSTKFISSIDRALRMSSTSHNIADCDFIACSHSVHIPTAGIYIFDNLQFSGNDVDIENSSAGQVTASATNTANPSSFDNTGGGTTKISNDVSLTVNVEDQNGANIESASIYVQQAAFPNVVYMNKYTSAAGQAVTTLNYTADVPIIIRIRKSSQEDTRYFSIETSGTIGSGGFTLTTVMTEDSIAS